MHSDPHTPRGIDSVRYNPSASPLVFLTSIASHLHGKCQKLLILVDEYDRFASSRIYSDNIKSKENIKFSVATIKNFYQNLKSLNIYGVMSISTGVSVLTLSEASSFNVCTNLSSENFMGDVVGFKDHHINKAFDSGYSMIKEKSLNIEKEKEKEYFLKMIKEFTNGYLYPGSSVTLYNSTLCTNIFKKYFNPEDNLRMKLLGLIDKSLTPLEEYNLTIKFDDPNVHLGPNPLGALKQLSMTKLILLELESMQSNLKMNLGELLSEKLSFSSLDLTNEVQQRMAILNILYSHGVITLKDSKEDIEGNVHFRIPNKISQYVFLVAINKVLEQTIQYMELLINNPSTSTLRMLLESIFHSLSKDISELASFTEKYTNPVIASFLRAIQIKTTNQIISFDTKLESTRTSGRPDIRIDTKKDHIIVEIKKISTSYIKTGYENLDEKKIREYPATLMYEIIHNQNGEDIYTIDDKGNKKPAMIKCETVGDVITCAYNQLTGYLRQMSKIDTYKNSPLEIKAFAYVHVGKDIIILIAHEFNGKKFADIPNLTIQPSENSTLDIQRINIKIKSKKPKYTKKNPKN